MPAPETVSRSRLEIRLAALRAQGRDPRAGLFGPDSTLWAVNRCSAVFLGAGRAALLQLAHPHVAWAIQHHSRTAQDPFGRFQRTFARVFAMVFGDLEAAISAARAVHTIHARIRGEIPARDAGGSLQTRYRANHPESLLWVHATLWDTSLLVYESVVRELSEAEKRDYYAETRRFAGLFGIPDALLPPTWEAFRAYVEGMLSGPTLHASDPGRRMAGVVLSPHPLLRPVMARYRLVTAHLLPERLAVEFGLERGGAAGQRSFQRILRGTRLVYPRLPRRLRLLPAYVEAERRLAGHTDRDRVGEWLSRILVGA